MNFIVIIPARFASSRLANKPLVDINGKPMIVRVMEKAKASGANKVIVATDHSDIMKIIQYAGGEACLTKSSHTSGIERLGEVVDQYNLDDNQIIINLQGDEPLMPPKVIYQLANNLSNTVTDAVTLATPITKFQEILNPNVVKVVTDANGYALYFSRAPIPWDHEGLMKKYEYTNSLILRHIGIYAYRVNFIRQYMHLPISPIEKIELLEQLRILWHRKKIYVARIDIDLGISVDTPEELEKVRLLHKLSEKI